MNLVDVFAELMQLRAINKTLWSKIKSLEFNNEIGYKKYVVLWFENEKNKEKLKKKEELILNLKDLLLKFTNMRKESSSTKYIIDSCALTEEINRYLEGLKK